MDIVRNSLLVEHFDKYRFAYQGLILIIYGLLNTYLQTTAVNILTSTTDDLSAQIHASYLYIGGYFVWSLMYFMWKIISGELKKKNLIFKRILKCSFTAFADLSLNFVIFITVLNYKDIFGNYIRGLVLPLLTIMSHLFIRDKLKKYHIAGATITFIGFAIMFSTGSMYYFLDEDGKANIYEYALGGLALYVLFETFSYFAIELLCRDPLDFQPREIIAYLGVWESIGATIILVLLNQSFEGHRIINTLEIISKLQKIDPAEIVVLCLLPIVSATINMLIIRIIKERNAGTSLSLLIIRSTLYFLVLQNKGKTEVKYTIVETIGAISIIYGCLIFVDSPVTPKVLENNENYEPIDGSINTERSESEYSMLLNRA